MSLITTDNIIEPFLQEAASATAADWRHTRRCPFFRPITITTSDDERTTFSAFSRDISPSGIGLLHNRRLNTQHVMLTIPTFAGRFVDIRTKIIWCKSCGEGWYASGGPFNGLSVLEVISLFSTTAFLEVDRRVKRRYPFFRPTTVTTFDNNAATLSAFSRDISPSGIGLLHHRRLNTQHVMLTVPTMAGRSVDIRTKIIWCSSCGDGWYASGGQIMRPSFEELPKRLL